MIRSIRNLFLSVLVLGALPIVTMQADTISRRQARNYIEHVIDTLFVPTSHTGQYGQELDIWSDEIAQQLLNNKRLFSYNYDHGRVYSTDKIYKSLLEKSLEFIEQQSVTYAYKELKNTGIAHKESIAERIAHTISSQAQGVINKSSNLESGALTNFIGAPLRSKVRELIEQEKSLLKDKNLKEYKRVKKISYDHYDDYEDIPDIYEYTYTPAVVYRPLPVVQRVYMPAPVYPIAVPHFGFGIHVNL